jgi:hypothetical protein
VGVFAQARVQVHVRARHISSVRKLQASAIQKIDSSTHTHTHTLERTYDVIIVFVFSKVVFKVKNVTTGLRAVSKSPGLEYPRF